MAGSYVPKTTAQLKVLTDRLGTNGKLAVIEIQVEELIASPETAKETVQRVVLETEEHLKAGQDTLVMTSRRLITGDDELSSLKIGSAVAEALVSVLQRIEVRPRYIVAKVCFEIRDAQDWTCYIRLTFQGGITSSDAATKGLNMKRATIVGQAAPGVPLWRCDEPTSRHRGVPFVVFPGNVGGEETLCELVEGWY
jgi:uncharacterized protein YgbK (DUF1537 family)